MDAQRLKRFLQSHVAPSVDVDSLVADFLEREPRDLRAWIGELVETGVVEGEFLLAAMDVEGLEVTGFGALSPRMRDTFGGLEDTVEASTVGDDAFATAEHPPAAALSGDADAGTGPSSDSRYDVMRVVGTGGMGVVHVAKDLDLRRNVAFKTLHAQNARRQRPARRFLNEVQITAQLDHPNVVPVYSLEVSPDGTLAYAMKLVRGQTFEDMIDAAREEALAGTDNEDNRLDDRIEVFIKVCDALAYAHSKGVIHRDLKPDNIMIGRFGEVYVMDWGVARLLDGTTRAEGPLGDPQATHSISLEDGADPESQTRTGDLVGTPAYMAPEQARGLPGRMGPWSDVFSLGLILYRLALLKPHYSTTDVFAVLLDAADGVFDPIESDVDGVTIGRELAAVIERATARAPEDRYANAGELAADLRRLRNNEETVALPDNILRRSRRWIQGHPRTTALCIASLLLLAIFVVIWSAWTEEVRIAEERARSTAREQAISEFVNSVAARAQRIDNHFLFYESALEGLAAGTRHALDHGMPSAAQTWRADLWSDESTLPPGTHLSPVYDKHISADAAAWQIPEGTPDGLWTQDLGRIQPLLEQMQTIFGLSPDGLHISVDSPEARKARIVDQGGPVVWAYIALESNGLMYMYPGSSGPGLGYDPRVRPWYRFAVEVWEREPRRRRDWSKPYIDWMGMGLILSAVQPIANRDNEFAGVAVIDVSLDHIIGAYMTMSERSDYRASYLLDRDGIVVIADAAEDDPYLLVPAGNRSTNATSDHGPFGQRDVLESVRRGESGYLRVDDGTLGWSRLAHLGWTYVVWADAVE